MTRAERPRSKDAGARRAWRLAGFLGVAGAGLLAVLPPERLPEGPSCAFLRATGLPCLTCGGTRAVVRMLHGDLAGAWAAHPLVIPLAAQIALAWGLAGVALHRGHAVRLARWISRAALVDATALLAIWVARLLGGARPT